MVTIGTITLDGAFVLAPMAGVTDFAFRRICRENGAALTTTEMVSAKALTYHDRKTKDLCYIPEDEHPVSVQIFGHEPEVMAEAAVLAREASGADILDINMGCPVNKVVKSGDGSALMKDPDLAGRIIRSVADAVSVPVTVKIRKGFDGGNVNAVEFAKMCEDSGASAVAVHGRTRVQMYQGRADWDIIREVRKALAIPVIANGDALTAEEAVHLLRYTGCPAAMIGRGSFGNPWIFRQAEALLRGEECPALPELPSRLDTAVRQITMLAEQTNEHYACLQARHQLPWYLHGVPHSGPFRQRFAKVSSLEELREITCEAGTRLSNPHISRHLNV